MEPKYQELAGAVRDKIRSGEYESLGLLPTEDALCRKYQVSRQTVRHALSVLADEGLIERRQGSGTRVRDMSEPIPAPHRSIAIVTTYISDYIFPSILREAENVLSSHNCTPFLFATQNQVSNERKVLTALLSRPHLDGVLVEGTKTALPNPNLDIYRKLMERGIPLVFMNGNYSELSGALSVLDDNYGGGYQLVKYLHAKGHRRIAGVFKSDDVQGHQRYAGYTAALKDIGCPVEDKNIYWYNTETKEAFSMAPGSQVNERMLDVLGGCTAVVCYNDEVASSLIMTLRGRGSAVPGDMAVVSFDNSRYSELSPCRITSLSHGAENVGRLAAELMVRILSGKQCQPLIARWTLVEKESS